METWQASHQPEKLNQIWKETKVGPPSVLYEEKALLHGPSPQSLSQCIAGKNKSPVFQCVGHVES